MAGYIVFTINRRKCMSLLGTPNSTWLMALNVLTSLVACILPTIYRTFRIRRNRDDTPSMINAEMFPELRTHIHELSAECQASVKLY